MTELRQAMWRQGWAIGFALALAAGILFRLIWLRDIEYKGDEAWTFTQVQAFWETHRLAAVGMPSSAGVPNAGMSLWVFIALGALVPLDNPLALARAVELVNIAAILMLAIFAIKAIEPAERESWLWSVALVAVNPFAVLFSRKIWAQDILPIFTVAMLIGWWHRRSGWGAFLWGLIGAILGQIHLGGFLFAAAFVACTLFFDRRSVRWSAWLIGTIAGALPLIPWLLVLRSYRAPAGVGGGTGLHVTFLPQWIDFALGADLRYSLGDSFSAFLAYPTMGATPLYLGAIFVGGVVILFALILARLVLRLRVQPALALDLFFGTRTATALALFAALWGYGLALTATLRPTYLHYFVIAFSLPMLWLARLERAPSLVGDPPSAKGRVLLSALVVAQACLTMSFLSFIHETRLIKGDYGIVYDAQPPSRR